jgi:muramoyltetrapeptide carboxypeptidase
MPIRPPRLQPGGTIGIIAPASPPPDPQSIDRGAASLERLGFKVKLSRNVRKRRGFLAGSDRERAADLMRMFTDRTVNAIVCVRGGHGATRLLPLLDYRVIRANAKIFVGHSDITALHYALLRKAAMISFHGPMLDSDFAHKEMSDFTLQSFLRTVSVCSPAKRKNDFSLATGSISLEYHRKTVSIVRHGHAHGQLIGGNLSLLCNTISTPWQPHFKGRILFLEDVGEKPYRFDRMLTYLLNCGLLQQVAGIAIGINKDCEDRKAERSKEDRQSLEDVFRERLLPLKVPIVMGLPFGHVTHNATLPVGAMVKLDADSGDLILCEAAVC